MTEQEFHTQRRMVVVRDKIVYVAPENYSYTHVEWFSEIFGGMQVAQEVIDKCVRGYVLGDRLVVYNGTNFSHRVNQNDVMLILDHMINERGLSIKEIGFGAVVSQKQPWEPRQVISVPDYRRIFIKRKT